MLIKPFYFNASGTLRSKTSRLYCWIALKNVTKTPWIQRDFLSSLIKSFHIPADRAAIKALSLFREPHTPYVSQHHIMASALKVSVKVKGQQQYPIILSMVMVMFNVTQPLLSSLRDITEIESYYELCCSSTARFKI